MSVWSWGKFEDIGTIANDDSSKDETKQTLVKEKNSKTNLENFLG